MKEVKRLVKGTQKLFHDLFKLKVAIMKKNVGWDRRYPMYEQSEHSHFYHTIDSNGRNLKYCAPTGGHTHEMIPEAPDASGYPKFSCGPSLICVGRDKFVPCSYDDHIHEVEYRCSEEIVPRVQNAEYGKLQAIIANKQAAISETAKEFKHSIE